MTGSRSPCSGLPRSRAWRPCSSSPIRSRSSTTSGTSSSAGASGTRTRSSIPTTSTSLLVPVLLYKLGVTAFGMSSQLPFQLLLTGSVLAVALARLRVRARPAWRMAGVRRGAAAAVLRGRRHRPAVAVSDHARGVAGARRRGAGRPRPRHARRGPRRVCAALRLDRDGEPGARVRLRHRDRDPDQPRPPAAGLRLRRPPRSLRRMVAGLGLGGGAGSDARRDRPLAGVRAQRLRLVARVPGRARRRAGRRDDRPVAVGTAPARGGARGRGVAAVEGAPDLPVPGDRARHRRLVLGPGRARRRRPRPPAEQPALPAPRRRLRDPDRGRALA